jgi:Na+/H+-dicarboxylate symporter
MSDVKEIGKTIVKALALFYLLTAISLLAGLAAVSVFHPGTGMNIDPAHLDPSVAASFARQAPPRGFVAFLLHIIPVSFVGAFAEGEVLPVLLLAIIIGVAIMRVGPAANPLREVIQSALKVLFAAFGFIIKLSPLGAFGAMAFTVGTFGIRSLQSLAGLVGTYYLGSIAFLAIVIAPLAALHGFNLWRLILYFRSELLIIFGTSTSEPVLPQLILKLERLGCQEGVVGMVLPLSYSFNLDGIALFLAVSAVFIAQACNIHLSLGRVLEMLLMMLLTSKGAAGVALIVGVDRFMSGMRAVTSTVSNVASTIVIAKWEDACDTERLAAELEAVSEGGRTMKEAQGTTAG